MNHDYGKAIPEVWHGIAKIFTALGDEHRQRILLLFERGERLNVGQIVAVSPLSRSAVSHHLRILREAGILEAEKIGKEVWFQINTEALSEALDKVAEYIRRNL